MQAGRDAHQGLDSRHHLAVVAVVAVALTVLGTLVFLASRNSNVKAGSSSAKEPRRTPGETLRVTPLALSEPPAWHVVFPADTPGAAKFIEREKYEKETSSDPFSRADLDAGGYLMGSATVRLELENIADAGLTVFDVRISSLKSEPVPLGAAIFVEPPGGDPSDYMPRKLYFDLDALPPVARQWSAESEPSEFRNFFDVERVGFEPGQKQTLDLLFETDRAAYSFTIEIRYEVGGERYVREITRNGAPFRVAVNLCEPSGNPGLSSARYATVRSNYPFLSDRSDGRIDRLFELRSLDPKNACAIMD